MKIRVVFNTGVAVQAVNLIEFEADGYHIDQRTGSLTITRMVNSVPTAVVVYAAAVWRSVSDVGLLNAAVEAAKPEAQRENSRRSQEARQARSS